MLTKFIVVLCLLICCFDTSPGITYSSVDCHGVPLDQKLIELMNYSRGYFIEVGGYDGVVQSNTKAFEECYGWHGILVEPSAILFPLLCQNRPNSVCFQCALGSFEEDGTFAYGDFDGTLMSSINGERLNHTGNEKVLMRSLQSILDEVKVHNINFFSLDTEGYELNILKGIDFSKTQFDYILIEIYNYHYDQIIEFLSSNGYEMIQSFTNYNKIDNPDWDGTHNDYLFKRVQPNH